MDPWGSCRAIILPSRLSSYTGSVELSWVPCSWSLQFVCMEYAEALSLSAGLSLPHNLYRTPSPPPLPPAVPSYGSANGDPLPGYRLVHSGVKLGFDTPPDGAIFFSGLEGFQTLGPIVNIVGRWRLTGLDGLRLVNAGDTSSIVELAMANGPVAEYVGDSTPVPPLTSAWAANPLPRENASTGLLRTSYITRVEGCSSGTTIQRLIIVNAGGAATAQGVVRCISNFAEEVAVGGYLAAVEGYYIDRTRNVNSATDASNYVSIVQLWFIWAVPVAFTTLDPGAKYASGGVRAVAPRLALLKPQPQCGEAKPLIPGDINGSRPKIECGQLSAEKYACPSYMCCGAARGRVGQCGVQAFACLLSSCDPRYGLCGVVPSESLEVTAHEGILGVAPASSPLSSPPPYTSDADADRTEIVTATVRYGASVYVLDKSATVSYAAALESCRMQTLLGLSWRLASLADAFAFEVSLLARSSFLGMLDNRVTWMQPRPENSSLGVPGCLTVSWNVDFGSVQLVTLQAADCNSIASVICKATWPGPPSVRSPTTGGGNASSGTGAQNSTQPAQWTPGAHSLSFSLIGIGQPNSGPACVFESFAWMLSAEEIGVLRQREVLPTVLPAWPQQLGINASLTSPLAAVAMRPVVIWSTVSLEPAAAYQTVASLTVQYLSTGPEVMPPVVLGSLDGTFLSANASYGAQAPAEVANTRPSVAAYLSAAAGWQTLELDVERGEVVVAASGCRGALLEQLVLRTSTGRTWTTPIGAALSCSVPFHLQAPPRGYLVALQVYGGSFVEEVKLVWGTPLRGAMPPAKALAEDDVSVDRNSKGLRPAVFGVCVAAAVLVPVLAVGIGVAWWLRRARRRRRTTSPAELDGAKAAEAPGGGRAACFDLLSVFVDGNKRRGGPGVRGSAPAAPGGGFESPREGHRISGGASPSSNATTVSAACDAACLAAVPSETAVDAGSAMASRTPSMVAGSSLTGSIAGATGGGSGGARCGSTETVSASGSASDGGVPAAAAAAHMPGPTPSVPRGEDGTDGMACHGAGSQALPTSSSCGRANSLPGLHLPLAPLLPDAHARHALDGGGAAAASDGGGEGGTAGEGSGAIAGLQGPAASLSRVASGTVSVTLLAVPAAAPPPLPAGSLRTPAGQVHQPLPPFGTDEWAQHLHAALFHKVLYQWNPPSLASPMGFGTHCQLSAPAQQIDGAAAAAAAAPGHRPRAAAGAGLGTPSVAISSSASPNPSCLLAHLASSEADGSGSNGTHRSAGRAGQPPLSPMRPATASDGPHDAAVLHAAKHHHPSAGFAPAAPPRSQRSSQAAAGAARTTGNSRDSAEARPPSVDAAAGPGHARIGAGSGGNARPPPDFVSPIAAGAPGEHNTADLLLGRDVLVDVDDPSTYLGHGTSGVVRRGLLLGEDGTWRNVAVKLLNRPNDQAVDAYRGHLKTLLQEITILGSLRHPNVVQLLGGSVSLQSGTSFLVEELCGRTLSHAIYDDSSPYNLLLVLRWCCDIARGLAYLHPNIMHRDLKPSNVLLDHNGTAKISDFGLARFKVHTTLATRDAEVGTTCYMSPECFVSNDFKVTAACDVYSLGVMINEMVTRQHPWSGVRTAVVGFKVAVVGDRPRLPDEGTPLCPPPLRQLIRDCWEQQPDKRPSSVELLSRLQAMLAEAEAEYQEAEVRQAEDGHRQAEDGHRQAEDGHRQAEDAHRQAEDGHRQAEDGHRQAEGQTEGMPSEPPEPSAPAEVVGS